MNTKLIRIAKGCASIALLLTLAAPRPGFSQIIDPIAIGPQIRITSPPNHAVFYAPVDIPIFAFVVRDVTTTNVEFYAGTNNLGHGFDLGSTHLPPTPIYGNFIAYKSMPRLGSLYCFVWTNAPAGSYALTAIAKSTNFGFPQSISRTSPPVSITILAGTTNTNAEDIVSIVATDPIAIAGTNFIVWSGMTNTTPAWTNWPPLHWGSFTNWGPKNALFTVRRFGDATAPITVNYNIGGTASNGVDYVALPGSLTIPAGGAYGLIPIVPVSSGVSNFSKTVVLTLTPATNTPNYLIGFPNRAAALVLERWPRPFPCFLPDGSFHVVASGPDGAWFHVDYSGDLQNWTPVSSNQVFQGSIDFVDPDAPPGATRFYRAAPLASPPSQ